MNYDFVVVGGGVAGCALAYELSLKGARIAVVEKGKVGGATSAVNQGGIRQQFSQSHNIRAGQQTVRRLGHFADEFGVDPNFRQAGYLLLLSAPETVAAYAAAVAEQNRLGVATRIITPADALEVCQRFDLSDVAAACFCPTDGYLDPALLMRGYEAGLKAVGVDLLEGTQLVACDVEGDKITSVLTTRGRLTAGAFINAAGPWANSVGKLLGEELLPVAAHESSIYVLQPAHSAYAHLPLTIDIDRRVTITPHAQGVMVGNPRKPHVPHPGDVACCDWTALPDVRRRAAHRLADLADAPAVAGWAGYWEVTPDDDPLIGRARDTNSYLFAGFSGHGMSVIPGLAPSVAQMLLGEEPQIELSPYDPRRFDHGVPARTEIWGGTAVANAEAAVP